jgi:hypothetical protein
MLGFYEVNERSYTVKRLAIFFVVFAVLVLFASATIPALAQEPTPAPTGEPAPPVFDWPDQLPATAQKGLEVVGAFFIFLSSLVTIYVTRWIRKLPLLTEAEKSKIAGLGADAVAGVISCLSFAVLTYGAYLAGFLDGNGLWSVLRWILAVWPTTWTMHKGLKFSRMVAK